MFGNSPYRRWAGAGRWTRTLGAAGLIGLAYLLTTGAAMAQTSKRSVDIQGLAEGDIVTELPVVTAVAGDMVGAVHYELSAPGGTVLDVVRTQPPYAMLDPNEPSPVPTPLIEGPWTLTVRALTGAGGRTLSSREVRFQVGQRASATLPPAEGTTATSRDVVVTVAGLPAVASGEVFAEVLVDRRIKSVRMVVPGYVNTLQTQPPYGLVGDFDGKWLHPWDTTAVPDGEYTLTVTTTLPSGDKHVSRYPFVIENTKPAPEPAEDKAGTSGKAAAKRPRSPSNPPAMPQRDEKAKTE